MTSELKIEAWARLSSAKPIHELALPKYGGRIDLRRLSVAKPEIQRTISTAPGQFAVVSGLTECRKAKWESLDFSGSQLAHLRFVDCEIVDCVFDECDCQDWRMWDTSFQRCTFRGADLRSSSLGAVRHKRNNFSEVDFSGADLTRTAYVSADFERCVFENIEKVDFQGSLFVDCVFKGELQEVLFYDLGFNGKDLEPNELLRADFSKAKFKYVEFRRLSLETVRFPQDEEHIIVEKDFPHVLEALHSTFRDRDDIPSRRLTAILAHELKWLGPKQRRGVLSKGDLLNSGGQEGLNEALRIIANMR
jgi:uncharacterized protein YjbI with pentapeptide repeats